MKKMIVNIITIVIIRTAKCIKDSKANKVLPVMRVFEDNKFKLNKTLILFD